MPLYEYFCITCDFKKEINRSLNDKEIFPLCEKCGYKMLRGYGLGGVQFKGSGFYKTDNR